MQPHRNAQLIFSFLIVFTAVLHTPGLAQTRAIARWKLALEAAQQPEEKADYCYQLAEALYSHNLEDGLAYAQQSLQWAQDGDYKKGEAQALTSLGKYYFFRGDMVAAGQHYRKALALAAGKNWDEYPAKTYLRLNTLHRVMANFDSARFYLDKTEPLLAQRAPDALVSSLWENRGLLANAFAHNDEALVWLKRAARLNQSLRDSVRLADVWRAIGAVFKDMSSNDSSFYYYDKAEALAVKVNDPVILMLLNLNRGETNFSTGAFEKSIQNYTTAVNLLKDHNYSLYYGIALFKIGEVHENEGSYHTAYEYFYNAIKEYERINARQEIQRTYTQIGWCYVYQDNFSQAMENAQHSLAIAQQIGDSASIGQNQNLVGYIHYKTKKYDDALASFEQAITIRKKIKDWYGYGFSLYNSALTYLELHQYPKAHALFLESIEVDKRVGKKIGILFTSNTLGLQYAKERNFALSAHYLAEANALAKSIPVTTQLLSNYQNYIYLYEAKNDQRNVIVYYKLFTKLKDSLNNEINAGRIAKADALFQLQKKANEILLMNKESELQQDRIRIQQREIVFQRMVIGLGIVGILILGIVIFVIYRLFRANKKSKEQLHKQNSEIIEQKEEIQAQSEELQESNEKLYALNATLSEKNEEIEMQSEKLKVANDALEDVNNSLEKRVDDRTRELNKAYHELETFFYHTSHDFRRPLTTYLGLVELANATLTDQQALYLFDKIKQTTIGLDSMLMKLQSISNVNYHDLEAAVDLEPLLKACVAKFGDDIDCKQIAVSVSTTAKHVQSNPFLLTVIVENLVDNAIQFSHPQNPQLTVLARAVSDGVEILVSDNGQGIDDRLKPRIFEMYYRANASSKGNGLGLYIVKRAVEKIGGTISFTSVLHQGSCFTVKVPSKKG
ncbi:tetratricopeptide repeat-containing sensor histidine kinase [Chryseolinea lacunae]|uniref:histidine kinase n=1 Tax=Chryseolinea lacunae TaxID=2801331 RepID=A0ABS1L0S1_9BACT|nr:tetratricopeptide repeat-containing sensor histidine kinase [Chryseolinea lacunae]MBL0745285.1 tetratricopeptide repeat protein [Chryseolinea lacunae]